MFTTDELKGKWLEVKGEISKKWAELTDDDLEKTKGNLTALVGLIQQKIGVKKEEAHHYLSTLADKWRVQSAAKKSELSDVANKKIDDVKDDLKNKH